MALSVQSDVKTTLLPDPTFAEPVAATTPPSQQVHLTPTMVYNQNGNQVGTKVQAEGGREQAHYPLLHSTPDLHTRGFSCTYPVNLQRHWTTLGYADTGLFNTHTEPLPPVNPFFLSSHIETSI